MPCCVPQLIALYPHERRANVAAIQPLYQHGMKLSVGHLVGQICQAVDKALSLMSKQECGAGKAVPSVSSPQIAAVV